MVGCPRPNRWLVEPDSTARFTQRALVRMKERAKALLSRNQTELSAARTLYLALDNADHIIEGGPPFRVQRVQPTAPVVLSAREAVVCEDSGRSARPPRVCLGGLRRHAGTHSPAH